MSPDHPNDPTDEVRALLRAAHDVRSRLLTEDKSLPLRDVYTLCFHLARELHHQYPDLQIMVGDRVTDAGKVQHHWLEFPGNGLFLDPAYDEFDSFQPVRIGRIDDDEFRRTYRNGLNSQFDIDDPRDSPEMLYRPRTAFDPERGSG
jgi:hypothetical protein